MLSKNSPSYFIQISHLNMESQNRKNIHNSYLTLLSYIVLVQWYNGFYFVFEKTCFFHYFSHARNFCFLANNGDVLLLDVRNLNPRRPPFLEHCLTFKRIDLMEVSFGVILH